MSDDLVAQLRTYFGSPLLPVSHQAADELERLSTENERLREALEKIATTQGGGDCCSAYEWFVHTKQIARAALAEKEENP